jgi:hypothetical protein
VIHHLVHRLANLYLHESYLPQRINVASRHTSLSQASLAIRWLLALLTSAPSEPRTLPHAPASVQSCMSDARGALACSVSATHDRSGLVQGCYRGCYREREDQPSCAGARGLLRWDMMSFADAALALLASSMSRSLGLLRR